jgi:hypothetical protein
MFECVVAFVETRSLLLLGSVIERFTSAMSGGTHLDRSGTARGSVMMLLLSVHASQTEPTPGVAALLS